MHRLDTASVDLEEQRQWRNAHTMNSPRWFSAYVVLEEPKAEVIAAFKKSQSFYATLAANEDVFVEASSKEGEWNAVFWGKKRSLQKVVDDKKAADARAALAAQQEKARIAAEKLRAADELLKRGDRGLSRAVNPNFIANDASVSRLNGEEETAESVSA